MFSNVEIEFADEYYLQAKEFVMRYPNMFTEDKIFWGNAIANEIRQAAIKAEKETVKLFTEMAKNGMIKA